VLKRRRSKDFHFAEPGSDGMPRNNKCYQVEGAGRDSAVDIQHSP
jgi:hypothetical protein